MAIYDVTRPLREQLDDEAILGMIRTYTPELLETFTLEEVLTPKRVIALARKSKVSQGTLVTYCAHYPYLEYPPIDIGDDIMRGAREGQTKDLRKLTKEEYRLMWEIRQARKI